MLDITKRWIEDKSISYRKMYGQYFTPDDIKQKLFSFLPKVDSPMVLEPAVGTGEFISYINNHFNNATIKAYDIDPEIIKLVTCDVECKSFLEVESKDRYDFIIGNPPYFEYSPELELKNKFAEVINGRINIYSLFIKHGIDLLKEGGYLAYVVPTSMNNGKYFSELREYIIKTCDIIEVFALNDNKFVDAQQNVQILILKKGKNTGKNIFTKGGITIFTNKYKELESYYKGSKSIKELGYAVKTGTIDWSKNKDKLSTDSNDTLLVWSHNIKRGKFEEKNTDKKPQFIKINSNQSNCIVVNRVIGTVGRSNIKAAIIKDSFLAENHVNVIYPTDPKCKIEKILDCLLSKQTIELLNLLIGNTQLSKTELENLIPIK